MFWRQQAYIRYYLNVDPNTLSLEQHVEAYAQVKFIIETNEKNNPLANIV